MNNNPYLAQLEKALRSRSVSKNFSADSLWSEEFRSSNFQKNDFMVSAGNCFASNLIPLIEKDGMEYLRTEELTSQFKDLPGNFGYRNFPATYGNIQTFSTTI